MELNLFFSAPSLQCTSIDRCALFIRAKNNNNILLNFSLLFHLKNIFSFFLFLSPASLLSSFFLLIFLLSLIYTLCFADLLHRYQPTFTLPTHATDTPQIPAVDPLRQPILPLLGCFFSFFFFFFPAVGCGVVVVVVVWVDRRRWVAGFIDISGYIT